MWIETQDDEIINTSHVVSIYASSYGADDSNQRITEYRVMIVTTNNPTPKTIYAQAEEKKRNQALNKIRDGIAKGLNFVSIQSAD